MQATVEYEPIVRKLLEKSEQGRLSWEKGELPIDVFSNSSYVRFAGVTLIQPRPKIFHCAVEGRYIFQSRKTDQGYQLTMLDSDGNELFSITGEEAVVYDDPEKEKLFGMLRDIFELARKKALNVDEKIATAAGLLDKV
jgi:hypothetical protein